MKVQIERSFFGPIMSRREIRREVSRAIPHGSRVARVVRHSCIDVKGHDGEIMYREHKVVVAVSVSARMGREVFGGGQ